MEHSMHGFPGQGGSARSVTVSWSAARTRLRPPAAVLLTFGLILAVATDGDLPMLWSKALFGLLFLINLVVIDWLIQ